MQQPTISVIIPTFNRARTLPRALDSVLQQRRAADQIIVVDDGSTDATAELLSRHYPQIERLRQNNRGVSSARNTGIQAATGDWIALLDSDDAWLPDKLAQQMACLQHNPDTRLIHSDEIWIRNGVRVNPHRKHKKYGGWIFRHCLPLCAISPSAAMIRRDLFDDIGWFDETLPACEDYDFWLRVCAREPVTFIDSHLIYKHGGHDDQLSHRYPAMDRFRIYSLAALLEQNCLSDEQQRLTRSSLRARLSIYTEGARKRGRNQQAADCQARYGYLVSD